MKGQNKLVRKILALVTTLTLAVTIMQPLKSQASEVEGSEFNAGGNMELLSGMMGFPDSSDLEAVQPSPEADAPGSEGNQAFMWPVNNDKSELKAQADGQSITTEITFYELNESGGYNSVSTITKEVQLNQTLKELGVVFPEMKSGYSGLTQIGWMNYRGEEITENTQPFTDSSNTYHLDIYPKYDKGIITFGYRYPDNEGGWGSSWYNFVYEYGETYESLRAKAMEYRPENMTKEYSFSSWEQNFTSKSTGDADTAAGIDTICFVAKLEETDAIEVIFYYYDQEGYYNQKSQFLSVPVGSTEADIKNIIAAQEPPKSYPGLRFEKWGDVGTITLMSGYSVNQAFTVDAIYENCLIRYVIENPDSAEGTIFCQVAEKGETVTARTSFEGFGEVTWRDQPQAAFVVNDHITIYGKASAGLPAGVAVGNSASGIQIDPIVTDKVYVIGSGSGAVIKCTGELKDFVSIAIDDVVLSPSDYTAVRGSTVITIMSSYLDKLSVGTHKVTLKYTYGSVDTTLLVLDRGAGGTNLDILTGILNGGNQFNPGISNGGNQSNAGSQGAGDGSGNETGNKRAPKTGDNANSCWPAVILLLCSGGLVLIKRRAL